MNETSHSADVTRADFTRQVLARSSSVPVLVDFWAGWCGPCRSLMPVLARLAAEYSGRFFLAKVDTEAERELAADYGIRSLPSVKLFRNGKVVDEFAGALPEPAVREFLDRHLPRESDKLVSQAREALAAGQDDQALVLLQRAMELDPPHLPPRLELTALHLKRDEIETAESLLAGIPVADSENPEVRALRAKLDLASALRGAPDLDTLVQAAAQDPADCDARYRLGARYAVTGDYPAAMEQFLEIVRRDRGYRDDGGRKALLAVFTLAGDNHPDVRSYRNKLAMAIN